MAKVFLPAVLLSGILALSGCAGLVPALEALGAGGGYPYYGGGQGYPYDPGQGGDYAQPVQPYYQPQPYVYYGNPEVYIYQQGQPVPPATREYNAPPSGYWLERRQQRQQDRIHPGWASGQLPPREARRLHKEHSPVRRAEGRMRADGNPNHPERTRLHTMPNGRSQDMNRQRYNGVQPGPRVQPQPARPGRPAAEMRSAAQPRAAAQPRTNGGRPARHDGTAP